MDIIYLEWSSLKALSNDDTVVAAKARQIIRSELEDHPHLFLIAINISVNDGALTIFLELAGTQFIAPETVTELERRVSLEVARPVSVQAWFRSEAVVSASGDQSVEAVSQRTYEKQEPQMKNDIQSILQRSGI